jgi:predicted nucleic acid-binding protein
MKVYVESVIMYDLDHDGDFQVRAARRMAALYAAGEEIVGSDLVRMECRVDPLRKGDNLRLARFDGFFVRPDVQVVSLTTAVFDRATQVRATYSNKTMDAINLAAAVEAGCSLFLTNDIPLSGFPDITVEILR